MTRKLYEEQNIQNIANAIREKNGTTTKYKTSEMAAAILAIQSGEVKPKYTNQVPTSIDTDGSIFNGTGYKNGHRLSSSGSVSEGDRHTTVIGFVKAKAGDTIRIKGYKWYNTSASTNYLTGYDSSFTKIYTGNAKGTYDTSKLISSMAYDETTGISTVVLQTGISIEYIRISVYVDDTADGANLIVTVNEEIIDQDSQGGGAVETCTVSVTFDGPQNDPFDCYYINGNAECKIVSLPGTIANVQKNTLVTIYGCSAMYNASNTVTRMNHDIGTSVFLISGDGNIEFQG